MKDYYAILEVSPNATQEQIKEQWRFLVHAWHPDKFPNSTQKVMAEEKIKEINEAYNILSNPTKRTRYDTEREGSRYYEGERKNQKAHTEAKQQQAEQERQQKQQAEEKQRRAEYERQQSERAEEERRRKEQEQRQREYAEASATSLLHKFLLFGIAGVILVALIFGVLGTNYLIQNLPVLSMSTSTDLALTNSSVLTLTSRPSTKTPIITVTPKPPTASLTLGIGSTMVSHKDGMTLLYVPAGEFIMGSDNGEADEQPVHPVYLDAFWIDQTEVTNAMYAKCVRAGKCRQRTPGYYDNADYANHPANYVSWIDAKTYCTWADRHLPTEAEWEKAARGESAFTYPWGNDEPNDNLLIYNNTAANPTEVGEYPYDTSPYGAMDMAGNLIEWVADWYSDTYYASSPTRNPSGPESEQYRVIRGGGVYTPAYELRSASRAWGDPSLASDITGVTTFRCAMSASP